VRSRAAGARRGRASKVELLSRPAPLPRVRLLRNRSGSRRPASVRTHGCGPGANEYLRPGDPRMRRWTRGSLKNDQGRIWLNVTSSVGVLEGFAKLDILLRLLPKLPASALRAASGPPRARRAVPGGPWKPLPLPDAVADHMLCSHSASTYQRPSFAPPFDASISGRGRHACHRSGA
jgi:hypothetical protein